MSCLCVNITLSQNIIMDRDYIDSLEKDVVYQVHYACIHPIIKKIHIRDTTDSYIEQHYYPNGQLYFQVPVINGKRNGMKFEYYPNGQFKCAEPMKDGVRVDDLCRMNSTSYNMFGKMESCTLYITIKDTAYKFVLRYLSVADPNDEPYYLLSIYLMNDGPNPNLVSEYGCLDGEWRKLYVHVKPADNSKQLLKVFLKEMKSFNYGNYMNIKI